MAKKSVLKRATKKPLVLKKSAVTGVTKPKNLITKSKSKPLLEKKIKSLARDEPVPKFDEEFEELAETFHIKLREAEKALKALTALTNENLKSKNQLFDEQFPLFLQVNSIKVPKIVSRIARIPLKHSLLTSESEVCLIVPDVKGIPNKNHEEHLEHYEKLLQTKDVTNIKKIMTLHEFRTEYETFELKRRLVELYDVFLVDGKISGKTVRKCGKIFYQKRKVPTSVKLQASKLKENINQALQKTPLYLHSKGDSFTLQIGHNMLGEKELVENIFYALKGLNKSFPGGFNNVRSINLFSFQGITVPLYLTLKNQNEISTAVSDDMKKPNIIKTEKGEITTKLNAGVIVKPTGEVETYILKRVKKRQRLSSKNKTSKMTKGVSGDNKPYTKKKKLDNSNVNDGTHKKKQASLSRMDTVKKFTKRKRK